ncbi:hypothetical protein MNB_SM-7-641 [hydrothermal vent metagenome]|uniref:Thymidylate kinase-like domain-containing protein n=1 Tax=hydrothermal vent metagenome TaxID=652676 RepID=A0A1W1BNC9_9ZZZZ
MNYSQYKIYIIKRVEQLGAKLLRDDKDIDFGLINRDNQRSIYDFLMNEGFVCFFQTKKKMNFKKFKFSKLIDIDVDMDINTDYLKQFFFDIDIKKDFERAYFLNPQMYQVAMNTVRYFMLLRAYDKKYHHFLISHRKEIVRNNFFLDKLTKNPFRREVDFDSFLKITKRDILTILKFLKFHYIIYIFFKKVRNSLFKRGRRLIAFVGVDGSGKSTIIKILSKELGYKSVYLGDRSIKFTSLYQNRYLKPFSFLIQFFEKFFRVFYLRFFSKGGEYILCDRYYFYEDNKKDSRLKSKLYNLLYNKIFIKPEKVFVLWNDPTIILSRKKEVSLKEIEEFNQKIEKLPFKNIIKIKNDDLDETLNQILKEISR